MPQPEGAVYAISEYLTNLAVEMMPGNRMFIGMDLFPNMPVNARKGTYFEYDVGTFMRAEMKELANAEPAPIGGFGGRIEKPYTIKKKGLATFWTDEDLAEAENTPMGAAGYETRKVRYVTWQAQLEMELAVRNIIRGAGWTTILQGVTAAPVAGVSFLKWDDPASEPIEMLRDLVSMMKYRTGQKPNTIVMPDAVINALLKHPDLLSRVINGGNNNSPAQVNMQTVAALVGVDRILEAGSVLNVAKEGLPNDFRLIWGMDVWIGYVAPEGQNDPEAPSAGYRMTWTGKNGVGPAPFSAAQNDQGMFINRFNTQRPAGYFAESYLFTTPLLVAADLGILLKDVVAVPTWAAV